MPSDEQLTDGQLLQRHTDGDEHAFRQLFERWSPAIMGLMCRSVRSRQDAEDLVQQTFLRLHRARHDFDGSRTLRPWLYTIAMNLRADFHRRRGRNREFVVEKMPEPTDEASDIRRLRDAQAVQVAIEQLSEGSRRVIELHWFEGFTFAEVADILGISRSAAKTRAHRAYQTMRAALDSR
jgi:RNA polymerase sigma-70 factor (ECF subfamily)